MWAVLVNERVFDGGCSLRKIAEITLFALAVPFGGVAQAQTDLVFAAGDGKIGAFAVAFMAIDGCALHFAKIDDGLVRADLATADRK